MIFKKNADDAVGAARYVTLELLKEEIPAGLVVIKPNIVELRHPPVTTDVRVVEGVVAALRGSGVKDMVIAEGSGTGDTIKNFQSLGYGSLGVRLIDLDRESTVTLSAGRYRTWREVVVPEILVDAFIISVPVLKKHSMCGVTISLKNMVGILPARHYSGYWSYKKSEIHRVNPHGCIADICRVMSPDWAVVDASVGMKGSHISGTPMDPPVNLVYGSKDPLEADIYGCKLLDADWEDIEYLKMIAEDDTSQPEN
jgi:uncharacterized protein (DUF362 family)